MTDAQACIHCHTALRLCLIAHANHDRTCCVRCDHPIKELS